jgi:molybdopterin-guanine dinucleotide biosynthesis protein A
MKSARPVSPPALQAAVLAGGLSSRMGADKTRLRLNGRPMLSVIRDTARAAKLPVRVIRTDAVPRCGPLGGMITALLTSKAKAVVFLACDMPLVTTALLDKLIRASRGGTRAAFSYHRGRIGFPILLPVAALELVQEQVGRGAQSIRELAEALDAKRFVVRAAGVELFNVNTPADRLEAERLLRPPRRGGKN